MQIKGRDYQVLYTKESKAIALSYSAVDAPKLTDEKMVQLAQEYMREMKIPDTQYIIAVSYTHLDVYKRQASSFC